MACASDAIMGAAQGTPQSKKALLLEAGTAIDTYPIKLTTNQIVNLFEGIHTKKTLTWKDVVHEKNITFRKCVDHKIDIEKLHKMQPDLHEWVRHGKVEIKDCKDLQLWNVNPFLHFKCCIGDLVILREFLPPEVLLQGGVSFPVLWERYGLTPEIMMLLKYTPEDWVRLGMTQEYFQHFNDQQWKKVFHNVKKADVADAISYIQSSPSE